MPKKGKRLREKRAKKKKESVRDLVSFEQEVTEKNRQLARLRQENAQLETAVSCLQKQLTEAEEDREDIQAHLARIIEQKSREIGELSEKLLALEEKRKTDIEEFRKREEIYKHEYRAMENSLGAEVKMAAGKLNALEDWRLARLDLMQKFEEQEKNMRDQEHRHTETLYQTEKSLIIEKSRMQEALRESLKVLAASLSSLSSLQISNTVHRVLRENVDLSRTLARILPLAVNLTSNRKWGRHEAELELDLAREENEVLARAAQKRKNEVDQLTTELYRLNAIRTNLLAERRRHGFHEELHKLLYRENKNLLEEKETLIRELESEREKESQIEEEMKSREANYQALLNLKEEVRECLKQALQVEKTEFDKEFFKNKLTYCLCRLLSKENFCVDGLEAVDSIAQLNLHEM